MTNEEMQAIANKTMQEIYEAAARQEYADKYKDYQTGYFSARLEYRHTKDYRETMRMLNEQIN